MLWMITDFSKTPSEKKALTHLLELARVGLRFFSFRDNEAILDDRIHLALYFSLVAKYPDVKIFFHKRPYLAEFTSKLVHLPSTNAYLIPLLKDSGFIVAISAHSHEEVREYLNMGADYVFISPVFHPLSKLGDKRDLIKPVKNKKVILLGGVNFSRAKALINEGYFNLAGITLFYQKNSVFYVAELINLLQKRRSAYEI